MDCQQIDRGDIAQGTTRLQCSSELPTLIMSAATKNSSKLLLRISPRRFLTNECQLVIIEFKRGGGIVRRDIVRVCGENTTTHVIGVFERSAARKYVCKRSRDYNTNNWRRCCVLADDSHDCSERQPENHIQAKRKEYFMRTGRSSRILQVSLADDSIPATRRSSCRHCNSQ